MKNSTNDQTETTSVTEVPITELTTDSQNANRGTVRGKKALKESLKKFGAGRSILIDSENTVISGNKTLEAAKARGYKRVQIVDVDGDTLIAVRRKDLSLKRDKKARELAVAENRVAELDLSWDPDALKEIGEDRLSELFEPIEFDNITNDGKLHKRTDKIDLQPPPKMIWILLGVPFNRFDLIQEPLAAIEAESEITVQQSRDK